MASVQPHHTSGRLAAAAEAERARLAREQERLGRRRAELAHELAEIERALGDLEQRLALLGELAGPRTESGERGAGKAAEARAAGNLPRHGYLRGAAIRKTAVRLLSASDHSDSPIHHSKWFDLLQGTGFGVGGRDPGATFLTEIGRSPVVVRAGGPGTYALDRRALDRLTAQRNELHQQLLALHEGQQTIHGVATVRQRRKEIMSAIARVERDLEEATESLLVSDSTLSGQTQPGQ